MQHASRIYHMIRHHFIAYLMKTFTVCTLLYMSVYQSIQNINILLRQTPRALDFLNFELVKLPSPRDKMVFKWCTNLFKGIVYDQQYIQSTVLSLDTFCKSSPRSRGNAFKSPLPLPNKRDVSGREKIPLVAHTTNDVRLPMMSKVQ